MMRRLICWLIVLALAVLAGCGGEDKDCPSWCNQIGEQTPGCKCHQDKDAGKSKAALSVGATLTLAISDNDCACVGKGNRPNGVVYNDASARCVALTNPAYPHTEFALVKFETVPACAPGEVPLKLDLTFSTTEWQTGAVALIRRVLVDWDPAALASTTSGLCTEKEGIPWAALGASGIGGDVSADHAAVTVPSVGVKSHAIDVTSLLSACIGAPWCSVRFESQSPGFHYWLASAGPALHLTCQPAPPGGSGGSGGTGAGGSGGATGSGSSSSSGSGAGGAAGGGAGGNCS